MTIGKAFLPGATLAEARAAADARQVEDVFLRRNGATTRGELLSDGLCPLRMVDSVLQRIARTKRRQTC